MNFPGELKMVQGHTQIFQDSQNVLEHIKISRRAFSKFLNSTYDFLRGKKIHQVNQRLNQELLEKKLSPHKAGVCHSRKVSVDRNDTEQKDFFCFLSIFLSREYLFYIRKIPYCSCPGKIFRREFSRNNSNQCNNVVLMSCTGLEIAE